MLKMLIWKDWREQRWRLAFGCVITMGTTAIALHSRIFEDSAIIIVMIPIMAFFLPLLAAMGVVAAEREEGSLPLLMALPVNPRWIFAVKSSFGAIAAVAPALGAAAVFFSLPVAEKRRTTYP